MTKEKSFYPDQQEWDFEYDFWHLRKCKILKQCIEELVSLLGSLSNSYRVLVGAADEFNRITLAKRGDVEDAIERADDLGDIIDNVIDELEDNIKAFLEIVCKCDFEAPLIRPGLPQPSIELEPQEELLLPESEDTATGESSWRGPSGRAGSSERKSNQKGSQEDGSEESRGEGKGSGE